MSYLDLTRRIHKIIQQYYPDGNINFEESVLAVKSIELSLFTSFVQATAQGTAKAMEHNTLPTTGNNTPLPEVATPQGEIKPCAYMGSGCGYVRVKGVCMGLECSIYSPA